MACSAADSEDELAVEDFLDPSKRVNNSAQKKKSSSSSSSSSKPKQRRNVTKPKRKGSGMVHLKKPGKRPKIPHSQHRAPDSKALDLFPKPAQASPDSSASPVDKIQRIAMGAKKDKDAYPTMDDIKSDWDDEKKEIKIKPKKMELDDKQKIIAMGAKKDTSAYPTMDDIMSDWDSNEDDKKRSKKKKESSGGTRPQKMWIGPDKKKR
ncbi:hypothetical protein GCK32_015145 [Trichostrongylus colubriformis]|uniref:Uncharacterized protein n=1 Tax=Trichostrongylus colubriformis TaxID=6319 RepID=A0AAN8IPL9_TRICO